MYAIINDNQHHPTTKQKHDGERKGCICGIFSPGWSKKNNENDASVPIDRPVRLIDRKGRGEL
jgi:hypothetical protein